MAPEGAPNVSARGADDANMGGEVAQRDISIAESISGDEMRDPRRRNSPSDPKCLQGMQVSGRGVHLVCKGDVELRGTRHKAARNMMMGLLSWDYCFLRVVRNRINETEVEQRGDSPVLVKHDGVTKSIFVFF